MRARVAVLTLACGAMVWFTAAPGSRLRASTPQTPARDATFQPTSGTASLSGVVVTDGDTPTPVRRAIVTLSGDGLRPSRGAITDDDGRFAFERLPAGRFILTAARPAFITSAYGAKRPNRPGTAITLSDGQALADLTLRLWRGGVLAGTLRDEFGRPVAGVPVEAVRAVTPPFPTPTLTLSNNGVTTDDAGEFRIFGLEPGTYVVRASPSAPQTGTMGAPSEADVDRMLDALQRRAPAPIGSAPVQNDVPDPPAVDFAPSYHPGTPRAAQATRVTVVAGQTVTGLDFSIQRIATATVEGRVIDDQGRPVVGIGVQLMPGAPPGPFEPRVPRAPSATTDREGAFSISSIPPGEYRLFARAAERQLGLTEEGPAVTRMSSAMQGNLLWAYQDLAVTGNDVPGLVLRLQPALRVAGRVVFDGQTLTPPEDLTSLRVVLRADSVVGGAGFINGVVQGNIVAPASVAADGTFELPSVLPDTYRLSVTGGGLDGSGWWLASATAGGRDALDFGLPITPGGGADVVITFTDRHSGISGTLQTASGDPASNVFVVAFAADRTFWGPGSRRVQAVRPDVDGHYAIADLPPGDYLLGALSDVDPEQFDDPAFLDQLVPASIRLPVAAGEQKVQDLRVGG
ncbi:MAG: carboxypeptidase-like regulatory domain-containing protein [Vicinamibacterales bacterium]